MSEYGSLSFDEQIKFFKGKLNIDTKTYKDIWKEEHAKAFMVAGATKEDVLIDLRKAVDKAISKGTTLAEFRKDFDKTVEKFGWGYNGGKNWRTRIIYDTNLRQSYNAGRWEQIQQVKKYRQYLRYGRTASARPRSDHLGLVGVVRPVDDSFWDTHYPQNGWGCKCRVFSESKQSLEKRGYKPTDNNDLANIKKKNPPSAGFDFNIGKADYNPFLHNNKTKQKYISKARENYKSYKLDDLPALKTDIRKSDKANNKAEFVNLAKEALDFDAGKSIKQLALAEIGKVNIEINYLVDHLIKINRSNPYYRSQYLRFIKDIINNPQEVWADFQIGDKAGDIRLILKALKHYDIGDKERMVVSMRLVKGWLVELSFTTFLPKLSNNYLNKQRKGKLLYKHNDE